MSSSSSSSSATPAEFRGAWIPSVNNSDWPSAPGLSTEHQKQELVALLDAAVGLNLNVIVLQIRPACDAFYASDLEPWSEYLTGTMGRPPDPFYDPLEFAVAEAHARGLQMEAWFNPYRVRTQNRLGNPAATHISRTRPELVREYGGYQWLDPGRPDVQDHTVRVISDVVQRYAVDGVHIDDYFYPYPAEDEKGAAIAFPDDETFAAYTAGGGSLARAAWRRDNVDRLIRRLSESIQSIKPGVRFGISPFGIWRPGFPPGIEGFDQYEQMYADPRKWLQEGWVDYLTPQLYWPTTQEKQSYEALLRWWLEQNTAGKLVLPGNATYRVGDGTKPPPGGREPWSVDEYMEQMRITRALGAQGNIHFFLGNFLRNPALAAALRDGFYRSPAPLP